MRRRRAAALWTILAVLAVSIGAFAALAERAPDAGVPSMRAAADARADGGAAAVAVEPVEPARAQRPRKPRMPTGRSVRAALRRALLSGAITRRQWASWRRVERRGRRALQRLSGARQAELRSVIGTVDVLASGGRLTPSRMPVAFLTVRRNVEVWTARRFPAPGQRLSFGRDPSVFQYFAGKGFQYHPLASAGRVNALVQPCLRARAARERRVVGQAVMAGIRRRVGSARRAAPGAIRVRSHCHARLLRRALDRLASLASRRGSFVAWEYWFRYGAGTPPWISGMAQATAAQALARGAAALDDPRYRRIALDSLGAFEAAPPLGVAVRAEGGRHYAMYSFDPSLRILNGFLQSVIGLHDVAELTGSRRAQRLFRLGERTARASVAGYDTGAWSLYSSAGRESPLGYHELVTDFLEGMCERTADAHYCAPARRFVRYLDEPPALSVAASRRLVNFRVSKMSSVVVSVRRGPQVALQRRLSVPRGRFSIAWRPSRAGRYTVRVQATGPEGRRAVERAVVRIKPPKRPKRRLERQAAKRRDERAAPRGLSGTVDPVAVRGLGN